MKRTLSFILALAMVATIALTLFVGVGAADGDLLWEANFNSTAAPYKPALLNGDGSKITVAPSTDGKTISLSFPAEATGGYAWGGPIESLKITEDTRYTVDVTFKYTSNADNGGITVVTGSLENPYSGGWYTLHGRSGSKFTLNKSSTSDSGFAWTDFTAAVDADQYVTFKFEIYGYSVRVYALQADGSYKLGNTFAIADAERETAYVACGMFTWVNANNTSEMAIKSFKVTQGCALTSADIAGYETVGLFPAYKAAKNGDLIWSANFNGDTNYAPTEDGSHNDRLETTQEVSDGGKTLVVKGHTYGTDATSVGQKYFYSAPINGLAVRTETEYTVEFKVKTEAQYGGIILYANPDNFYNTAASFYGGLYSDLSNNDWHMAKGTTTSKWLSSGQFYKNAYTKLPEDIALTDGYFDMKAEIDGYRVTVYYKTADGYKTLISYNMDDADITLACGIYNYQSKALASIKDFNVYKGLTVSNDYTQVPDEPEVPDTPVNPNPNPGTGDATVVLVLALIATISLGGVMVAKKAR